MKFFTWQDIQNASSESVSLTEKSVLCIGGFDGPHRGHKSLFNAVLEYAQDRHISAGAITFSVPPKAVNDPSHFSGCISTLEQKKEYFASLGFDFLTVIDFTDAIKTMDGIAFLDMICKVFSIQCLVSGKDFRCGYKAATGIEQIQQFCIEKHMDYQIIKDTTATGDSEKISSTMIRQCITAGNFNLARELLGYEWTLDMRNITVSPDGCFSAADVHQILPAPGNYPCRINGTEPAFMTISEDGKIALQGNSPLTFMQNFANIVFV